MPLAAALHAFGPASRIRAAAERSHPVGAAAAGNCRAGAGSCLARRRRKNPGRWWRIVPRRRAWRLIVHGAFHFRREFAEVKRTHTTRQRRSEGRSRQTCVSVFADGRR